MPLSLGKHDPQKGSLKKLFLGDQGLAGLVLCLCHS